MTGESFIDVDFCQKAKHGQVVSGDVFLSRKIKEEGRIISVLSDGLGSGVKASVLANLTATMALRYTSAFVDVRRSARTIMDTLPICEKRKISYSTFTIVDLDEDGKTRVIEHGNPPLILLRGQQGFSFSFIEEMWSRNLPNILMSPLRPAEFVVSLVLMSLIRLAVGVLPVTLLAIVFFGFNLWALGVAFGAFFVVLMFFAWSIGLFVSGLLLRLGLGAENLVWSLMFFVQPLGAVYYPVSTLPTWVQPISWSLPPTYVFEGLRAYPGNRLAYAVRP